jgi:hypothetical protein
MTPQPPSPEVDKPRAYSRHYHRASSRPRPEPWISNTSVVRKKRTSHRLWKERALIIITILAFLLILGVLAARLGTG